jgi:hypothetical protein
MLMVNPAAPMVRARKVAEGGSLVLMVAVIAIVASTVRQHIADPALNAMAQDLSWMEVANVVLTNSALTLPSIYLILALLQLREALQECFFTRAAGEALQRAGYWALWAMFAKMILAPTIYGMFGPAPQGLVISYDTFDVGIIGFAALLMLAGRVLETATTRIEEFA